MIMVIKLNPSDEYNIAVISQVRGAAKDAEINSILQENNYTAFKWLLSHAKPQKVAKQLSLVTN